MYINGNKINHCGNPQLVIPATFEQCFTYEKQILFLHKEIEDLKKQVQELLDKQ